MERLLTILDNAAEAALRGGTLRELVMAGRASVEKSDAGELAARAMERKKSGQDSPGT